MGRFALVALSLAASFVIFQAGCGSDGGASPVGSGSAGAGGSSSAVAGTQGGAAGDGATGQAGSTGGSGSQAGTTGTAGTGSSVGGSGGGATAGTGGGGSGSAGTGGAPTGAAGTQGGAGSGGAAGAAGADTWDSYAMRFFTSFCVSCHNDDKAGTAARDYHMMANVVKEKTQIACGVSKSQADWTARGCKAFPPARQFPVGNGAKPTDAERDRLLKWIDAGTP